MEQRWADGWQRLSGGANARTEDTEESSLTVQHIDDDTLYRLSRDAAFPRVQVRSVCCPSDVPNIVQPPLRPLSWSSCVSPSALFFCRDAVLSRSLTHVSVQVALLFSSSLWRIAGRLGAAFIFCSAMLALRLHIGSRSCFSYLARACAQFFIDDYRVDFLLRVLQRLLRPLLGTAAGNVVVSLCVRVVSLFCFNEQPIRSVGCARRPLLRVRYGKLRVLIFGAIYTFVGLIE